MRTSTALVLIGLGALGLSFAAPLVKWISLGPTTIGVYRMGLASLALALMVPVGGRKALGGVGRGRGWWVLQICGVLQVLGGLKK